MKTKLIAFLLFISLFSFGQVASGCGSSNWPSSVPTNSTGVAFTVPAGSGSGWTYKWVVTHPSLQIVSGGNSTTAYIKGVSGYSNGVVYVTRYKDGVSACADMKSVNVEVVCNYTFTIVDEYTSGPESNNDYVELSVAGGNNFPAGTTYKFTITRQDGTVDDNYPAIELPNKRRWVLTSFENPIVGALVTATYLNCSKTVYKSFRCPIPNSYDIYGNLREECQKAGGINKIVRKVTVSPNPTSSIIKFDGKDLNNYKVSIFNRNGTEIIMNSKIDQEINIEKQEKGIYFYIITDDNGFKQEGKIIKE